MYSDVPPSPLDRDPYSDAAGAPSAEALRAMCVSERVARQLYEAGHEVRFTLGASSVGIEIVLCELDGLVLSHMSPGRALEIAAGSPIVPGGC